jgi:UDP-N-acetylmuramoyl-tripeptide--D-alanyl-D-alanine ligase
MNVTKDDLLQIGVVDIVRRSNLAGMTCRAVSTDSRTIARGDVFVALKGESFDGHRFVGTAAARGAICAVVERGARIDGAGSMPLIVVDNTTLALGRLARQYRRKFSIPFIAVAGSNGKTTTKELIAHLLATRYRVLSTTGNLNNHIGVPQTLLRLERRHDIAVVEIGTNHPGELTYLCSILEPTHGIITNIGHEHMEFFRSLNGVERAEGELFRALEHDGFAYVNAGDPRVVRQSKGILKTIRYGWSGASLDVRGRFLRFGANGCGECSVRQKKRRAFNIRLSIPGRHAVENALAAAVVALSHGIRPASIKRAMRSFMAVHNRMEALRIDGVIVLNDTYNANPDSMLAALETGAMMRCRGKRIAVLGDMFELGAVSRRAHEGIGRAVGRMKYDRLMTVGRLAKFACDKAGLKAKQHYDSKQQLAKDLKNDMRPGDLVLVKGSRGMKMEEIVASLQKGST